MKLKNTPLTALMCASLLGSAALSQGAVLWSDDFNSYSDGGFAHQGGGTGWGGNWYNGSASVTSGVANNYGGNTLRRELGNTFAGTVGAAGTLWMSFDWGQDTAQSSWGGITFFNSSDGELGKIGNTDNSGFWNVSGATPTLTISSAGMKTGVARIVLGGAGASTVDLWVGDTGSPVDVSVAAYASSTGMTLNNTFKLRILGGDNQQLDNLVVGTTMLDVDAIPEPSAALLGGLGMLCLLRRRRA